MIGFSLLLHWFCFMNCILSPKYVVYDVKNFTIIKSWLKWSLNGKGRESSRRQQNNTFKKHLQSARFKSRCFYAILSLTIIKGATFPIQQMQKLRFRNSMYLHKDTEKILFLSLTKYRTQRVRMNIHLIALKNLSSSPQDLVLLTALNFTFQSPPFEDDLYEDITLPLLVIQT